MNKRVRLAFWVKVVFCGVKIHALGRLTKGLGTVPIFRGPPRKMGLSPSLLPFC